jgi:hypothetical protein
MFSCWYASSTFPGHWPAFRETASLFGENRIIIERVNGVIHIELRLRKSVIKLGHSNGRLHLHISGIQPDG